MPSAEAMKSEDGSSRESAETFTFRSTELFNFDWQLQISWLHGIKDFQKPNSNLTHSIQALQILTMNVVITNRAFIISYYFGNTYFPSKVHFNNCSRTILFPLIGCSPLTTYFSCLDQIIIKQKFTY